MKKIIHLICAARPNFMKAAPLWKALKKDGWKVITIWECRLKSAKVERALAVLLNKLPV